jgi:hypothetical protein
MKVVVPQKPDSRAPLKDFMIKVFTEIKNRTFIRYDVLMGHCPFVSRFGYKNATGIRIKRLAEDIE